MKSLHDFAGELRAAKRRLRRGLTRAADTKAVAKLQAAVRERADLERKAKWRQRACKPPDGRREWEMERRAAVADDYGIERVRYAAEACKRVFGEYPVAVALPVSRYGGSWLRSDRVEFCECEPVDLLSRLDLSAANVATSARRHTVKVERMYNGGEWRDAEFEAATWVRLRDDSDWVDTRNMSGRYPLIPGRQW